MRHTVPPSERLRSLLRSLDEPDLSHCSLDARLHKILHLCEQIKPQFTPSGIDGQVSNEELLERLRHRSTTSGVPSVWYIGGVAQALKERLRYERWRPKAIAKGANGGASLWDEL
jgi:hypothetical protein